MELTPLTAIIHWAVDPEIFSLGFLHPRWYGMCFALGFLLAYHVLARMYQREGLPEIEAYRIFVYAFVGTLIGARLGHCLFYDPAFYLSHPLEIIKIWEGGLASHGAVIGIAISLYVYTKRSAAPSWLWVVDRAVIPAALGSCFIRLGNLFNSEIIGVPTDLPWAFVFERIDNLPRHPAQLYEAICYLLIFLLLKRIYWREGKNVPVGKLSGILFTLVFSARFFIEFIKENQVAFESGMTLNMGQWLSIPIVALGVWLMLRAKRNKANTA